MSEDFFESILPPVKAVSEPQHEPSSPAVPIIATTAESSSVTDIERLWEEINASDDLPVSDTGLMNGSMHTQSSIITHSNITGGGSKRIPIHNGMMRSPSINNGGKVYIVPNKRKSQFIQEQPAKVTRTISGLESRKVFEAVFMNRNNLVNMNQQTAMEVHEEEQEEEAETHTEIYAQYQPLKLKKGKMHPYPVVESSSLASVEVPNIRYNLSLPPDIISQGRLSNVQLESVIYACQRHEEMLPNGERAGYLIGDGAGVGKGRTLAAIIYENYILKRKRSIWISVSNDLKHDAERDLRDLGADIGIHALNKLRYAKINSPENGNLKKGVLFTTYASLIGECQSMPKSKYKTRFKQIVQWFGVDYNGVIVFDECHKAKNLMPQGSQKKTKTAELVLKLQETLPLARIIYSSATGASEPRNMAYMTRLGLWGAGTPFKKFEDFVEKLEDKVGAMELVAVDMKQRGMYIARQLSFANVTFRIQEVELANVKIGEHRFFDVYNESVDLWIKIFVKMNNILSNKMVSKKFAKTIWGQYWAAHQRFFKYLCMAGKVQECVKITIEAISQQKCVVIGLQSTGEAKTNEMLEESGGDLVEFVSCAKGILQSFILKFFPTEENIASMSREKGKGPTNKAARKKAGSKKNISLQDALGRDFLDKVTEDDIGSSGDSDRITSSDESDTTVSERSSKKKKVRGLIKDDDSEFDDDDVETLMEEFSRRCDDNVSNDASTRLIQRELLDAMDRLSKKLPINTLDDLIRELGGPDFVAEMSGRKGRMVMDVDTGDITYNPRREVDVTLEQINLVEKDRFNTCQKLVAIISDAASTGISLHADKRYDNSLQRVHITLELPWSADRAIQQFGRTHRSNQLYPPEYVFLISDLAGERRFASTVAKRLESLGALTHGDRRATETRDLSQFNIDNKFGRRALDYIFDTAFRGKSSIVPLPPGIDLKKTLETVGLQPKDSKNVSKFLNRILGMHLNVQNALFQYYSDTMDYLIKQAKRNQEFDRGIIDLAKEDDNIFVEETQDFRMTFLGDDIKVQLHRVKNITGMSWRSTSDVPKGGSNSLDGFYVTKNDSQRRIVLAVQKKDRSGTWFTIYSPNVGEQTVMIELKSLNAGYRKVTEEDAERIWNEIYSVTEDNCMHIYWYKQCKNVQSCDIGCRSKIRYVLSGSIFYIWDIISSIHKSPQLARVRLNDGSKIIGCIINPANTDKIREILVNRRSQPPEPQKTMPSGTVINSIHPSPLQYQKERQPPKITRPIATRPQFNTGHNQYLVQQHQQQQQQNIRTLQRMPTQMMSPLTTVRVNSPQIQRKVVISQGSLVSAPQQHGNIRFVHMQNSQPQHQRIMLSPNIRFSGGSNQPGGLRVVYQQSPVSTFPPSSLSSSPQIISVSGKVTAKAGPVDLTPITFMDLT